MINSSSHFSYRDSCIESESYADRGPAPSKKIDPHSEKKKIAGNSQNDVKKSNEHARSKIKSIF